jgi:hypothetical protein
MEHSDYCSYGLTLKIISKLISFPVTQRYRVSFIALYCQIKCNGADVTATEAENVNSNRGTLTANVCPDICT